MKTGVPFRGGGGGDEERDVCFFLDERESRSKKQSRLLTKLSMESAMWIQRTDSFRKEEEKK